MFNNIPSFLYKQKSNFHNFFTFIFPTKIINPKYLLTMYSKIVISCIQQHTRTFSLIILFSTAFYHFYTNKNQTFTIFFILISTKIINQKYLLNCYSKIVIIYIQNLQHSLQQRSSCIIIEVRTYILFFIVRELVRVFKI